MLFVNNRKLVLFQTDIGGFSATQMRQREMQAAGNGQPVSRTATT